MPRHSLQFVHVRLCCVGICSVSLVSLVLSTRVHECVFLFQYVAVHRVSPVVDRDTEEQVPRQGF